MTNEGDYMYQRAPYPRILEDLIKRLEYKKGWEFILEDIARGQGSHGLTLSIYIEVPDSYNPQQTKRIVHYMLVPPAAYDERSWTRWLLDQILLVEQHEACEFFKIDGKRPYSPNHSNGRNPYSIIEKGTLTDAAAQAGTYAPQG